MSSVPTKDVLLSMHLSVRYGGNRPVLRDAKVEIRQGEVLGLVEQLPEKHRQVVMLFYMEDKSYEDVARLLQVNSALS